MTIYNFALEVTRNGKEDFDLSQWKFMWFFHWHRDTIKSALRALEVEGLFVPCDGGLYRVRKHEELRWTGRVCWEDKSDDE